MHGFRQSRMRENRLHEFCLGRFERPRHRIALDQFSHLGPDHMRAKQFARFLVEDGFDQPLVVTKRDGLAIGQHREPANTDVITCILGRGFGHANRGNLWPAICAPRNSPLANGVDIRLTSQFLDTDDAFMARLVRQPWRPRNIADGIDAGLTRRPPLVGDDMATVDGHLCALKPQLFGIADDADSEDGTVGTYRGDIAFKPCRHAVLAFVDPDKACPPEKLADVKKKMNDPKSFDMSSFKGRVAEMMVANIKVVQQSTGDGVDCSIVFMRDSANLAQQAQLVDETGVFAHFTMEYENGDTEETEDRKFEATTTRHWDDGIIYSGA